VNHTVHVDLVHYPCFYLEMLFNHTNNNTMIYMCSPFLRADIKVRGFTCVSRFFTNGYSCLAVTFDFIFFLCTTGLSTG
jgi:hypothetical protein